MRAGFIGKTGDVAGITTTYALAQVILLDGSVATEVRDVGLPAGATWESLEVEVSITAGAPTELYGFLTYDAAGDELASSEATMPLVAALTTANLRGGHAVIGMTKAPPRVQQTTAGKLYLWLKTDAGTVTHKRSRMHWHVAEGK